MGKQKALKIINLILPVLLAWQLFSGFFRGWIGYETFEVGHTTGGLLLAGFALIHLILNWGWVKNVYFKRAGH